MRNFDSEVKKDTFGSTKNDSGNITYGVNSQIPLKATLEDKDKNDSIHRIEVDPNIRQFSTFTKSDF